MLPTVLLLNFETFILCRLRNDQNSAIEFAGVFVLTEQEGPRLDQNAQSQTLCVQNHCNEEFVLWLLVYFFFVILRHLQSVFEIIMLASLAHCIMFTSHHVYIASFLL